MKEIEKKAMQFQILENNLQMIKEKEREVLNQIEDINRTKIVIEELKGVKNKDAYLQVGAGNFVSGKIHDTENIIVGVGGGVAVKKSAVDAKNILDGRLKDMENILNDLSKQGEKIVGDLRKIQEEVQKLRK